MAQQVGNTSGTAPASLQTEITPGGASEVAQGGTAAVVEAGQQEPVGADLQAGADAGPRTIAKPVDGTVDGVGGRVRALLRRTPAATADVVPAAPSVMAVGPELDLASNDPLIGYLLSAASAVDITGLHLKSPALEALKDAGVVLVVPLISSGSLVGLLSLGPRRSERGYSTDDVRLLNSLAGYAAPAMRVGQLVRQQQA